MEAVAILEKVIQYERIQPKDQSCRVATSTRAAKSKGSTAWMRFEKALEFGEADAL